MQLFLQALLQNNLVPRQLVVQEGADLRHQGIQCLVIHFMAAMANIQVDHTLLQPLNLLMVNPGACGVCIVLYASNGVLISVNYYSENILKIINTMRKKNRIVPIVRFAVVQIFSFRSRRSSANN